MLKKMRWRVILSAMLAFTAVVALIGILVNLVNFYTVTERADQTLSYISKFEGSVPQKPESPGGRGAPPDKPFMALPDLEMNYMTRFFIVRFDKDGNTDSVYTDYIASVDSKEAEKFAREVLEKDSDSGYIGDYRYACENVNDNKVVILLNVSRDLQFIRSLRNLTLAVAGASLVLVFILVFLFSGKAIKPIMHNIERQKRFITDASHELKTPLTSISTSLDVITMEHGDDEWTDNIRSQTDRMSKLVSELVTLSKLDEELPIPVKEEFSLSGAAWETVEVFQPQAKAHEKKLVVDIQEDISMVGEKNAIMQMLSVLLDNAIRYSDENGEIRFDLFKKRNRINIVVFNTCRFDTSPDVKRLFDRFYRPDNSRSTETGGTGIGLAIAKAVVQAHGGTIDAICPSGETMTMKIIL